MNRINWMLLLAGLLLGLVLLSRTPRQVIEAGNIVILNYTVILEDGSIYDSTVGRGPLEVTLGQGTLLANFEQRVIGMHVGESKTFTLSPEQAYGQYKPDLVGTLDRSQLAENLEPEVGKQVQTEFRDGSPATAVITSFTDTSVTLDANHPLAGQTLTFKVQVLATKQNVAPAASDPISRKALLLVAGIAIAAGAFAVVNVNRRRSAITTKKRARLTSKMRRQMQHR